MNDPTYRNSLRAISSNLSRGAYISLKVVVYERYCVVMLGSIYLISNWSMRPRWSWLAWVALNIFVYIHVQVLFV